MTRLCLPAFKPTIFHVARKCHHTSRPSWPRVQSQSNALPIPAYKSAFARLTQGETLTEETAVRGRVWSIRQSGAKLAFVDVWQDSVVLQCVLKAGSVGEVDLKAYLRRLSRGDIINISGRPHRTSRNELSILATALPQVLAPCLRSLPDEILNEETRIKSRHVDLLVNPHSTAHLRLRASITRKIRTFLEERGFLEVHTPILAQGADGAVARPFTTRASEFADRELSLRIAPELWLKRLIMGGFDHVYEMGPSFRNEGINLTHNPEFWTCEFYATYLTLNDLLRLTEDLFALLGDTSSRSFARIDFVPALEACLGECLPCLESSDSLTNLLHLFQKHNIETPSTPDLPRLLDKLSSVYLEDKCQEPTWIINHPECLSPLSKSFCHPDNGRPVAARGELFAKGRELVNTYEEENSPLEQRRKFQQQKRYRGSSGPIDESYLQAMEHGMPPTGGWGCGLERLCMHFGGTERIADTLAFGTLRNVVSLASART